MKRLVLLVVSLVFLISPLDGSDIYQKGKILLIPDDAFAQDCDWAKFFIANLPTPPEPYMETNEYLALASDNTIYVVESNNYTSGTVFKFAPEGTLLSKKTDTSRKVNTSVWARHLELPALNDRNDLWISEYARLNRCDTQGNVLATIEVDHPITDLLFLKGGKLVLSGYVITGRGGVRHSVSLFDVQTEKESVIVSFNSKKLSVALNLKEGLGIVGMGQPRSSVGRPFLAATPEGRLVVGYSDSPEILLFSPAGHKINSFTLPIRRPMLNPEQKAQAVQRISKGIDSLAASGKVSSAEIARAREKLKSYPTELPYYSSLLADQQGNILVFPTDPGNSGNMEFMAFSQSGKTLGSGRFTLPQGMYLRANGRKQMVFRDGWLYALINKSVSGKNQVQLARFRID